MGGTIDQRTRLVQRQERGIVEPGGAAAKADLRQARAGAHDDRKSARADLQIERPGIARRHMVELAGAVGDDASEDVEPAGRGFRVGGGGHFRGQRQALHQRHDIDAAGLEHRAHRQVDLVQLQRLEPRGDAMLRPRQEAGADAIGDLPQAQIEARRLDLVGIERTGKRNRAAFDHLRNLVCRKDPGGVLGHGAPSHPPCPVVRRDTGRKPVPAFSGTALRAAEAYLKTQLTPRRNEAKKKSSRGHLGRPACSHVKQIAKRSEGTFPTRPHGRVFYWKETGHGEVGQGEGAHKEDHAQEDHEQSEPAAPQTGDAARPRRNRTLPVRRDIRGDLPDAGLCLSGCGSGRGALQGRRSRPRLFALFQPDRRHVRGAHAHP